MIRFKKQRDRPHSFEERSLFTSSVKTLGHFLLHPFLPFFHLPMIPNLLLRESFLDLFKFSLFPLLNFKSVDAQTHDYCFVEIFREQSHFEKLVSFIRVADVKELNKVAQSVLWELGLDLRQWVHSVGFWRTRQRRGDHLSCWLFNIILKLRAHFLH